MALSGLCSYDDVIRQADVSLATASDEDADITDAILTGIDLGHQDLTLDLTKKLQKVIAPYQTDGFNNTPAQLVDKITDEGKAFLNQCALLYSIRAIYRKGKGKMRFRYQEAGDVLGKEYGDWDKLAREEFASVCPLLTFDQDGNGTVTLMERIFMNQFTSVRVTV